MSQAGGEKGQPGMASRPNRELPEKKVFLLREGDVRGTLGWYGMSPLGAVPELIQVMSLNLPMVGAVNYAKGDYLKEYGISEMLSTFEVLTIFFKASQLILLVVMMVRQGNLLRYSRYATRPVAPKDNHMINSEQFTQCICMQYAYIYIGKRSHFQINIYMLRCSNTALGKLHWNNSFAYCTVAVLGLTKLV